MDQTYTSMMSGVPTALLIWLGLIVVSAAAFAVMAAVAGRARRSGGGATAPAGGSEPVAPGYVPRNEAMLRALAAAKAVTDDRPAPGAARGSTAARPKTARRSEVLETVEVSESSAVTEVFEVVVDAPEEPRSDEQRFADELATAAARAGVTADRRQAEWEAAQRAVDAAWQAYEEAESAATRAIRAAAFPTPETPLTPAEYADREKYLHRAAQAAHARGELDTDQLIDALSHRNGFDPRLHPFEQDALLRRLARDGKLRAYKKAAELERTAWHEAEQAKAAKRSLDREAAVAAMNVAPPPQPAAASRRFGVARRPGSAGLRSAGKAAAGATREGGASPGLRAA